MYLQLYSSRYCSKSINVYRRARSKINDSFVPYSSTSTRNTGGIRQNLFENYYFEKLHTPHARGAHARARAAREGRRDQSTMNNLGSKLKIRLTGALDGESSLVSIDGSWEL
jgi:hypothetical protein